MSGIKFGLRAGIAIVVAALLLGAEASSAQDKPELVIGSVVSTTGPAAGLGVPERNAILLFEETIAKQTDLPFKVRFIVYDDGSDPTRSVTNVRKLIDEDRVHLVICCTTTPSSMAILETVKNAKIPNMAMASAATVIEPVNERHWIFKTVPTERIMFRRIFDHMKSAGIKKIAFSGLEDSYGESGWVEFQRIAKEYGIEIAASERFARTETNMTPQALRLRQANADAVYVHAIPPSANLMHQALTRVGFKGAIYHGAGVANKAFLGINPASIEGAYAGVGAIMIYDQLPDGHVMKPVLDKFVQLYETKYGKNTTDMFSVSGWDSALVTIEAAKRAAAAGVSPANLEAFRARTRDEIEKITKLVGTTGVFTFTPTDHLGLDLTGLFVAVVKDGRFRLPKD